MDSSITHRITRSKASDRKMPATPSPTKSDASEQVQQLAPVASLNSSTPHCEDPVLPGLGALHREWLEPPSKCPGQTPSEPTLPIRQLQHESAGERLLQAVQGSDHSMATTTLTLAPATAHRQLGASFGHPCEGGDERSCSAGYQDHVPSAKEPSPRATKAQPADKTSFRVTRSTTAKSLATVDSDNNVQMHGVSTSLPPLVPPRQPGAKLRAITLRSQVPPKPDLPAGRKTRGLKKKAKPKPARRARKSVPDKDARWIYSDPNLDLPEPPKKPVSEKIKSLFCRRVKSKKAEKRRMRLEAIINSSSLRDEAALVWPG